MRGKKRVFTPTHIENMRKANSKPRPWRIGVPQSAEHIKKRVEKRKENGNYIMPSGEKHYLWKSDRTLVSEKHRIRGTIEWKNWREIVFKRDNYTCQECGQYNGYLEPNHIIPLRLDMSKKNLFNINNGITLCRPCHQKTIRKEEEFIERYMNIVAMKTLK